MNFSVGPKFIKFLSWLNDFQVSMLQNFFPSSLTMRPNKLEHLSLETLSSQVLEFESKARANPIIALSICG